MYAYPGIDNPSSTAQSPVLRTAEVRWSHTAPVRALRERLGDEPLALLTLFVSPMFDFEAVAAEAQREYPDCTVVACTTAGEIGQSGYDEGLMVATGYPRADFACIAILIDDLDSYDPQETIDRIAVNRVRLQEAHSDKPSSFAFLMVDGLSRREDVLSATIAPALRDTPLFGASAGDGLDFRHTRVALNGLVREKAAVLMQVRSRHRMVVFSHDHFAPSDVRMVVTEADPERRIVKSINAEPAAREYARIVGMDPEQLDRFTFAAHPVVVRLGDKHHVRAIQQVNDKGELVFFSAIDEGMVLTVAHPQGMRENLLDLLETLSRDGRPSNVIACDCILRRIEAERSQEIRALSGLLSDFNVTGFSTYGEQVGSLHVNQTMTGVAFYAGSGSAKK